jgi:ribosome biogenesis GTPase A
MNGQDATVRAELLSVAEALARLAAAQDEAVVQNAAAELSRKIQQNRFHLVLIGQFKRGKSTVLNALLGAPILPVAVLPLTSVVTVLRYGESPEGVVFFQDGRQTRIDVGRLTEFVTEKENPRNRKSVGHVEVFYPSEYLHGGVTFIDTPGIGSVYTHNTQVTYDFLPRSDAAIFVTSPEPPLTSVETELLADLAPKVGKTFVVMNKADLVDRNHLAEVLSFTRHTLPAGFERSPIFSISARQALEARMGGDHVLLEASGFPRLERELNRFLRDEKSRVFLNSVRRSLLGAVSEFRMHLALEIKAARMPVEELREKLAEFNQALALARQQQEDNEFLLKGNVARLAATFEGAVKEFAESQLHPLLGAVRVHFDQVRTLPRRQLAPAMDRFLASQICHRFDRWRADFESTAAAGFREFTDRFQGQVNELIHKLHETAGALFGVEISGLQTTEELAFLESEGYQTDPLLDWGLGNAPLLLPGGLFRRYVLSRILKKVPEELERNATRVAYDFKRRLDRSASAFRQALAGKLAETIEGIQRIICTAIERHESGSVQADEVASRLSTVTAELDRLEQKLRSVTSGLKAAVEA